MQDYLRKQQILSNGVIFMSCEFNIKILGIFKCEERVKKSDV